MATNWFDANGAAPGLDTNTESGQPSYYSLLNALQQTVNPATGKTYTGAEAVGMAARDADANTVPSSAKAYLTGGQAPTLPTEPASLGAPSGGATGGSFAMPNIDWSDPAARKQAIIQGLTAATGQTPDDSSVNYFLGKWDDLTARGQQLGDPSYAWKRLIGYEAGPGDYAKFGPYANGQGYSAPADSGGPQQTTNPLAQPFNYPTFSDTFSYQPFQAPTAEQAQQAPGFQAALKNGLDALTRSAAAQGSALNTGTLKNLQNFAQDAAAQNYQQTYNNALQTYGTNFSTAQQQYVQKYQQYLNGLNAAQSAYGLNAGVQNQLFGQAFDQSQAQFQNQLAQAQLGLQGTLAGVNAGGTYANNASNLATQSGNAGAAGTVGAGNAVNQGLGNFANMFDQYNIARLYAASPYGNSSALPNLTLGGYQ